MKIAALFGCVGFAALLMTSAMTTVTPAYAQRSEDCRDRVRHAERHLDRMIERFGRHSGPAREARDDLERTRDRCFRRDRHDRDGGWDHRRHDGWDRGPH
jgi:hypothetical protein